MAHQGVHGPTGKPAPDTHEAKPDFKSVGAFGPGVGAGGDKMSSDKPVAGPRN